MNLSSASAHYLDNLPSDTSPETIRLYRRGCQMFRDVIGDKDVSQVTELDFDTYCQYLTRKAKNDDLKPWTQHAYTRGVVGLLIYLSKKKLSPPIDAQTLWDIRKAGIARLQKAKYKLPDGVDEFAEKVYAVPSPPSKDPKVYQRFILEHAFVSALVSSGARIHEICKLKVSDFQGNRAQVKGKGDRLGWVNFTARAMEIINKYLAEREAKSPYLFPAIRDGHHHPKTISTETGRQILYRWLVMVLGDKKKITPHTFRHHTIILGIKRKGLRWAQKQARHVSVETTIGYDESDADEVTQAYDEVFG